MAFSVLNFSKAKGVSFKVPPLLHPAPPSVELAALKQDKDPNWVSVYLPWHPKTFLRANAYLKFFVHKDVPDRSYREWWATPVDMRNVFTDETIGYVSDIILPIMDSYFPEQSTGHHAAALARGLKQKRNRAQGNGELDDEDSDSYFAPVVYQSHIINLEVWKLLPAQGLRWLYIRASAKRIEKGRLSKEIVIMDEGMLLRWRRLLVP